MSTKGQRHKTKNLGYLCSGENVPLKRSNNNTHW